MIPPRSCQHCGVAIERQPHQRDAARFCSRKCSVAARTAAKVRREQMAIAARVALCRDCLVCGTRFSPSSPLVLMCSDVCRRKRNRDAFLGDAIKRCATCGRELQYRPGHTRHRFCSRRCRRRGAAYQATKRISKLARKVRERAVKVESVDPIRVFERDGWLCQGCGVQVKAFYRGTWHPLAPELDHIVPLAAGGDHSTANTQTLCRACNAEKGASLEWVGGSCSLASAPAETTGLLPTNVHEIKNALRVQ